jgi:hypothetical protein
MYRFLFLFGFVTLTSFVASGAVGEMLVGTSDSDFLHSLLQSGSIGMTYAGATMLAIRWLGTRLLDAKDSEIQAREREIERCRHQLELTNDSHAAVAAALSSLNATLIRMDTSCDARTSGRFKPRP